MMTSSNENIFRVTAHLWRPVTLNFDGFFDLPPNKRLSKQSWEWLRRQHAHHDVTQISTIAFEFDRALINVSMILC